MSASGNTVQTASKQPCIRIKLNTYTITYSVTLLTSPTSRQTGIIFTSVCRIDHNIGGREIRRGIYTVRVELPTNILRKTICLNDTLLLLTIALTLVRSLIPWTACGPRELAHITNNHDVQDSRSRTQLFSLWCIVKQSRAYYT